MLMRLKRKRGAWTHSSVAYTKKSKAGMICPIFYDDNYFRSDN